MDYEFDYWHFIYVPGEYYPSTSIRLITDFCTGEHEDRKDVGED